MKKDKLLEKFKRMKQRKRPKRLKFRRIKPFLRRIASDLKKSLRTSTRVIENQDNKTMCLEVVVTFNDSILKN